MIGKIKTNSSCKATIDYITAIHKEDKRTKLLLHSDGVLCTDNPTMAACLDAAASKGDHNLVSPVKHISLSFHPKDAPRMTDEFMIQVAKEYMELMDIKDTEFVLYRHFDRKHPHCHLVFSRVNRQGKLVKEGNEQRRNCEVCRLLTEKYRLYMPKGKEQVNKERLHDNDKHRYAMMEKVMKCKDAASDWKEFETRLNAAGVSLRFRYNNVTGKLMGVSFSDGEVSFSGKQLDNLLTYAKLTEQFGDLKQIAHDNVREFYDNWRERELERLGFHFGVIERFEQVHPPFEQLYPDGTLPQDFGDLNLLSRMKFTDTPYMRGDFIPADDYESGYVALNVLADLLLQPYQAQVSAGGGGGGSESSDNDRDRDKERDRFRFNFRPMRQTTQITKPKFRR